MRKCLKRIVSSVWVISFGDYSVFDYSGFPFFSSAFCDPVSLFSVCGPFCEGFGECSPHFGRVEGGGSGGRVGVFYKLACCFMFMWSSNK